MLKKWDLKDCYELYPLLTDPTIFSYVRQKPSSCEEYLFMTKINMEKEEMNEVISRVILNELGKPIGSISLFDVQDSCGFLGTWIGSDYHGKGYNKTAKELFFDECFTYYDIETIYIKIRKTNERSKKAILKFSYVTQVSFIDSCSLLENDVNVFHLFQIKKEDYIIQSDSSLKEA